MDWPRLDTRYWNLSLGVAASTVVAGCGPTVFLDEETDSASASASATDSDTDSDTEVDPTTTVGCNNGTPCDPGYECIDDVCIPYYYCQDGTGGCCYDGCCYGDCYYSECYDDEDCGPGALCNNEFGYGSCEFPQALPGCDPGPEPVVQPLPGTGEGGFVSLAFVDANGDAPQDLVVGREGTTELHYGSPEGPGGAPAVLLPVPPETAVLDAASGDFDGDGDPDLALSTSDGTLLLLANDGVGGFVLLPQLETGAPLVDIEALQWNGDVGGLDVAGVSAEGQAVLHLNGGGGVFVSSLPLPTEGPAISLARTDVFVDGFDDLLVQDQLTTLLFWGDFSGDLTVDAYLPGQVHGPRRVLSGDVLGDGPPLDAVGVTTRDGWALLEVWPETQAVPFRYLLEGDADQAVLGDFSGDGISDVAASAGIDSITFAYGSGDSVLSCRSIVFPGLPVDVMAAGDFDGDGRSDLAIEGSGTVALLRMP